MIYVGLRFFSASCMPEGAETSILLNYPDVKSSELIVLDVRGPISKEKRDEKTGIVYREHMPEHFTELLKSRKNKELGILPAPAEIRVPNSSKPYEARTYRSVVQEGEKFYVAQKEDTKVFIPSKTKAINIKSGGEIEIISK